MNEQLLTKNLEDNINLISSKIPANFNFINRELKLKGDIKCSILYINGLANQEYIEGSIIYPLLFKIDKELHNIENLSSHVAERYIASYDCRIVTEITTICYSLKHGKCIALIENSDSCIICNTTGGSYRPITESNVETNLIGGKEAFVENIEINIALLQQKFKNDYFKMENYVVGDEDQTDVILMYVDNIIDKDVLNGIREKLKSIKAPYVPNTGYITQYIEDYPYCTFPQTKTTESPDKIISDMLQGKAAIMTSGSPQVIVLPVVMSDFFQTLEDYSDRFHLGNFNRFLRVLATIIILTIAPIYLVLLEYNIELLPLNLIKILINSRLGIPLSPFLEIFLMELIIEFLREGGLRLPTPIGQTLGIVGGIVLGEAATEAGLVSSVTLVIVAIEVISTFIIPNYEMTLSIRFLRFPLLILGKFFGFLGIIVGLYLFVVRLVSMDSFGIPYFSPLAPLRTKSLRDVFVRFPLNKLNEKPDIFKFTKNKENGNE